MAPHQAMFMYGGRGDGADNDPIGNGVVLLEFGSTHVRAHVFGVVLMIATIHL